MLIKAELHDCVVELTSQRERPERWAGRLNCGWVGRRRINRRFNRDGSGRSIAIDIDDDVIIGNAIGLNGPLQGRQCDAFGVLGTVGLGSELSSTFGNDFIEARSWHQLVNQHPVDGTLTA